MKIFKYDLEVKDKQVFTVPYEEAKICHIGLQNDGIKVWMIIDPDNPGKTEIPFAMFGTGHEFNIDEFGYCDTFIMKDGNLVIHLFIDLMNEEVMMPMPGFDIPESLKELLGSIEGEEINNVIDLGSKREEK